MLETLQAKYSQDVIEGLNALDHKLNKAAIETDVRHLEMQRGCLQLSRSYHADRLVFSSPPSCRLYGKNSVGGLFLLAQVHYSLWG